MYVFTQTIQRDRCPGDPAESSPSSLPSPEGRTCPFALEGPPGAQNDALHTDIPRVVSSGICTAGGLCARFPQRPPGLRLKGRPPPGPQSCSRSCSCLSPLSSVEQAIAMGFKSEIKHDQSSEANSPAVEEAGESLSSMRGGTLQDKRDMYRIGNSQELNVGDSPSLSSLDITSWLIVSPVSP